MMGSMGSEENVLREIPEAGMSEPQPGSLTDFDSWAQHVDVPQTNVCVVVDDEPKIARIEAMIVQSIGYTVHIAHSGVETLELVDANQHFAGIAALGGPDDPLLFQLIHDARGADVADLHLALQQ